ncbi:serine/threonine-protein kinase rio2 [Culex quinquefasciatus]|uniref:non-specific serine/threonine protein kinase n=1 Tax=Culex quinquefasciatus TaxID=7176 RepID=B0WJ57_CULQU|nr:serine/threonine-protein kinase rio2 [Culex quinquefasciatus]|eukprot:XP_001848741.1 serine/threonine-protein kinase rio2 [Culex quinquefasciatus]
MGYDYLALKSLTLRGSVAGNQIGVGKESNIYTVGDEEGDPLCLKLHRLRRVCFRNVKEKRDYHGKRHKMSWLYLRRISATREYAYMKALYDRGFPVPRPVDFNRHCVIMELVDGYPLTNFAEVGNVEQLYDDLINLIVRLGNCGVIHGDFTEFNVMITEEDQRPILIYFPQMVSTSHPNADIYFDRIGTCRAFGICSGRNLGMKFSDLEREDELDREVLCSGYGFTQEMEEDLHKEFHQEGGTEEGGNLFTYRKRKSKSRATKTIPRNILPPFRNSSFSFDCLAKKLVSLPVAFAAGTGDEFRLAACWVSNPEVRVPEYQTFLAWSSQRIQQQWWCVPTLLPPLSIQNCVVVRTLSAQTQPNYESSLRYGFTQ